MRVVCCCHEGHHAYRGRVRGTGRRCCFGSRRTKMRPESHNVRAVEDRACRGRAGDAHPRGTLARGTARRVRAALARDGLTAGVRVNPTATDTARREAARTWTDLRSGRRAAARWLGHRVQRPGVCVRLDAPGHRGPGKTLAAGAGPAGGRPGAGTASAAVVSRASAGPRCTRRGWGPPGPPRARPGCLHLRAAPA